MKRLIEKRYPLDRVPRKLDICHYRRLARYGLAASRIIRCDDCVIWQVLSA